MSSIYHVIGLMSGTSLDGLDIVFCQFNHSIQWQYKILKGITISYPDKLKNKLRNSINLSGYELTTLDHELGRFIGNQINIFSKDINISPDFIASHGHTVFHQPEKGITLQIGNLHQIYALTKTPVIGDFRSLDVALGGQGAPLVPIGDQLLFESFDYCLNLGGIANISNDLEGKRIAYDICPNNLILNFLANKIGHDYDDGGQMAQIGELNHDLFNQLNEEEYFNQHPPKSLGIEWLNEKVFPLIEKSKLSNEDLLCTYCHHIAFQISRCINIDLQVNLLITGGGAFNKFLIKTISQYCGENVNIVLPEKNIIEYKEALVFAFLGVLKWQNEINILKSVTGAAEDSCSGTIILSRRN